MHYRNVADWLFQPKADLSCRSTRAEVGTIFTQGSFLTLKYTTDPYSNPDNGFRLIITAFKEARNYKFANFKEFGLFGIGFYLTEFLLKRFTVENTSA